MESRSRSVSIEHEAGHGMVRTGCRRASTEWRRSRRPTSSTTWAPRSTTAFSIGKRLMKQMAPGIYLLAEHRRHLSAEHRHHLSAQHWHHSAEHRHRLPAKHHRRVEARRIEGDAPYAPPFLCVFFLAPRRRLPSDRRRKRDLRRRVQTGTPRTSPGKRAPRNNQTRRSEQSEPTQTKRAATEEKGRRRTRPRQKKGRRSGQAGRRRADARKEETGRTSAPKKRTGGPEPHAEALQTEGGLHHQHESRVSKKDSRAAIFLKRKTHFVN